ncbi:MAG: hypothetical protein EOO46_17920 [Flavobacterium sp.]|nr:MAG: hypothetical protein EOO46_17920 [Flavobacterium sp.]
MGKIILYHPNRFEKHEAEITEVSNGKFFLTVTNLFSFEVIYYNCFESDLKLMEQLINLCNENNWIIFNDYWNNQINKRSFENFYDEFCE